MEPEYTITIAEQPASEPVTAAEPHEHLSLNVALDAVEDLLNLYITAAREQFEHDTDGLIVLPTVFRQHMRCFTTNPIKLYRGNVLSVDAVSYYDGDEVLQTLTGLQTDLTGIPALVYKSDGFPSAWSTTRQRPITVEFTCGWANVAAVPQSVRLAIMWLAAHYYNAREAVSEVAYDTVPMTYAAVVAKRRTGLGGI